MSSNSSPSLQEDHYTMRDLDTGDVFNAISKTEDESTIILMKEINTYYTHLEDFSSCLLISDDLSDPISEDQKKSTLLKTEATIIEQNTSEASIMSSVPLFGTCNNKISPNTSTLKDQNPNSMQIRKSFSPLPTFMCDICDVSFKSASNMRNHKRNVHRTEEGKQFDCQFCSKSFSVKSYLARHELRHSNRTLISCILCKSNFKTVQNLKLHLFTTHILGNDHFATFSVTLNLSLFHSIFVAIQIDGSPIDKNLKIVLEGKLTDQIKCYNVSQSSSSLVQVIFHKRCTHIMTVYEIFTDYYSLVCIPHAQCLSQSQLVKRNGRVEGFEVDVLAKICVFLVNSETYVIIKDGLSKALVPASDLQVIQ